MHHRPVAPPPILRVCVPSLIVATIVAGCASSTAPTATSTTPRAATEPADSATPPAHAATGPVDVARWRRIKADGPPPGVTAAALLPEVEQLLASPDPAIRDGLGYELLAAWLMSDAALDDAAVATLRDHLMARLTAPHAPGDAVFARSFAALGLSVVAAREARRGVWTAGELDAAITAAASYAARETDLRGFTGEHGWAHAAAHTADWLKFLGRHPRLTAAQARTLLDAIASLVTRRHGARFGHGEDERLAAAARAVLRRGLVDDAAMDAWLAAVGEPLGRPWPEPFDPVLYAAQRNARDLLVSLFVALSFDDAAPAAAALARLRAFMAS